MLKVGIQLLHKLGTTKWELFVPYIFIIKLQSINNYFDGQFTLKNTACKFESNARLHFGESVQAK